MKAAKARSGKGASDARRKVAPGYTVDLDLAHFQPAVFPETDEDWIEVLRRPPQTWTPAQVAHWAQRPAAHGGGELGEVVSRRLWDNAIDGFLLLCGPGGPRALCGRLGIVTAPEREAFEQVVAMLDSLPDRIAYREVVLPPPPGLLPPQLHPSQMSDRARQGLATPGRVGVHRQRPAGAQPQPHERWTGLWAPESGRHGSSGPSGGGTPSRSGGAGGGRAVGLTERERMLQDARTRAAAAAAAAAAGEEQGLPPGRRTGPRVRFRDDGRDASPQSDQGLRTRERDGGGERVEAEKGQGSGGEADDVWVPDAGGPEGAALRHLHQMGELAAAHQDAAMRLKLLRNGGLGALRRLDRDREELRLWEERQAVEARRAAEAAAGPPPPPPPLEEQLEAVSAVGAEMRREVQESNKVVDDLARVPLRRAMRQAAEAAEAEAEARGGSGSGTGSAGKEGSGKVWDAEGNTRVRRDGWREVGEEGKESGRGAVRGSLSATGRAVLAEADAKEASYEEDPYVYDDEDFEQDSEEEYGRRGRAAGGKRRAGKKEGDADEARRRVLREVRETPWAVPGLREEGPPSRGASARGLAGRQQQGGGRGRGVADGRMQLPTGAGAGARAHSAASAVEGGAGGPLGSNRPGSVDRRRPSSTADASAAHLGGTLEREGSTGAAGRSRSRSAVRNPTRGRIAGGASSVEGDGGQVGQVGALGASRGGGRPGPLHVLPGLLPGRGRQPGSHESHPPRNPDLLRTADMAAVRQVLARGKSAPVHHTLKSKLMEDATRHRHAIAPHRSTSAAPAELAAGAGKAAEAAMGDAAALPFFPPQALLANERAAAHEVALRQRLGLPVTPDLVAARELAAPRQPRRVVAERKRPQPDAEVTKPDEDGAFTSRYGLQVVPSPNDPAPAGPRRMDLFANEATWIPASRTAREQPYAVLTLKPQTIHGAFPIPEPGSLETHGPTDPNAGASATRGSVLGTQLPAGGRLAAPEAHVRGVGGDVDIRRAMAARAAEAGEAAARGVHVPGVSVGLGGGAVPQAQRSTSAWRARGGAPLQLLVRGEWGDPALERSLRDTIRYLNGGPAPAPVPPSATAMSPPTQAHRHPVSARPSSAACAGVATSQHRSRLPHHNQHDQHHAPGEIVATPGVSTPRLRQGSPGSRSPGGRPLSSPGRLGSPSRRSQGHQGRGGAGGWAAEGDPLYCFRDGKLVYTGSRPPFDASYSPPYRLHGRPPGPMGQPPWTKADAERLAGAVAGAVGSGPGGGGNTELHWAAGRGDTQRVGELLRAEADPTARAALANTRNASGETPLHRAAACRTALACGSMSYLLAAGADPDARDIRGATPLLHIITEDCWQPEGYARVRLLLGAGARADLCDVAGETLLHKALIWGVCSGPGDVATKGSVAAGLNELLALLLPLAREPLPPPHLTAHGPPDAPDIAHMPHVYGYEPESAPRATATPLKAKGDESAPGEKPQRRVTFDVAHPLAAAAAAGTSGALVATVVAATARDSATPPPPSVPVVPYALDVNARDARGRTPLHVACCKPHSHAPGMERCCVSVLLAAGAHPNAPDDGGRTPLHVLLLDAVAAARLRAANTINHAKLATARPKQSPKCLVWLAEELLRAGADPRVAMETAGNDPRVSSKPSGGPDRRVAEGSSHAGGHTPLHLAALARSRPLLRLLLRFGADPGGKDGRGRTVADVLQGQLRDAQAREDRQDASLLSSMLELLQGYSDAAARRQERRKRAAVDGGRGVGKGRRGGGSGTPAEVRPGLGGGRGPKSLRQLYMERFGDSSGDDMDGGQVDELDPTRGPLTQQDLVAAYMAAMRAGRAVGVAVGAGAGTSPTAHLHRPGSPEAAAPHPHDTSLTAVAAVAAASTSEGEEGGGSHGRGGRGGRVRGTGSVGPQEAAVKIQAAFRGHRTRSELRKAGVMVESPVDGRKLAAGTPRAGAGRAEGRGGGRGAGAGGGGKRLRPEVPFVPPAEYGPEHERAATKIQAAARGRAARKRVYEQRRAALAAAREAEAAVAAAAAASTVATEAAQGGRPAGSAAGPAAAIVQQQQRHGGGPPAAAAKPSVLNPAGVPYGAQHDVAAARIQASWKGRKARTSFKRILAAASDPSDALHLDLELDEEQLAAMEAAVRPPPRRGLSRGASRGRNSGPGGVGHSGGEEQQGAGTGGQLGVVQEGAGEEGGGVRVGAGREGGRGAGGRYTPSEGGGSDKVAPSVGWSEASSAVSLGFDTLPPPEAPALPPPRRSATGTPLAHPRAPAAGAAPYVPAGTQAHTAPSHGGAAPGRALQRSASSRQGPRVVPQVVVTDDGRIAGDVDDLDLLDLDSGDDDEDAGQGLGEDGSVPSGVGLVGDQGGGSFRVVQHGDDDGDGDSVF